MIKHNALNAKAAIELPFFDGTIFTSREKKSPVITDNNSADGRFVGIYLSGGANNFITRDYDWLARLRRRSKLKLRAKIRNNLMNTNIKSLI